jgi:hypothetical protein
MDVDREILPHVFLIHGEIDGDTPEIMHSEPLLYLNLDLPNQALVRYDEEIIEVPNDCGNDYALILILEHKQSSVDTCCHKLNRDNEILERAIYNARTLLQATKRLCQVQYHLPRRR